MWLPFFSLKSYGTNIDYWGLWTILWADFPSICFYSFIGISAFFTTINEQIIKIYRCFKKTKTEWMPHLFGSFQACYAKVFFFFFFFDDDFSHSSFLEQPELPGLCWNLTLERKPDICGRDGVWIMIPIVIGYMNFLRWI